MEKLPDAAAGEYISTSKQKNNIDFSIAAE